MKTPKDSTSAALQAGSSATSTGGRRGSQHARLRDRKAAAGPGLGLSHSSGRPAAPPGDRAHRSSGRRPFVLCPSQEAVENDPMSLRGSHLAGYPPRPPLRRLPQGPTPVRGGYGKGLSWRSRAQGGVAPIAPARAGRFTVEVELRVRLTLGPSGGTRGSFHVVVRLLWSTKKGQPVCGSILISQPGGRGSRSPAPLPDAICITGDWVAALMLGRGPPGARS